MTLCYFDVRKLVTIQVDASGKGLKAALLQEGRPVAFASKALTPTEQRYANIERELLACVFGAEHFHTYVFGQAFTIESDHKPLEQINLKNLADTPACLQRMLLRLQNYDLKIKYKPGKQMILADALSRYAPQVGPEVHSTSPFITYTSHWRRNWNSNRQSRMIHCYNHSQRQLWQDGLRMPVMYQMH